PNYAPGLVSVRTLHDELYSLFVQHRWLPAPKTVSFQRDVYPTLQRLSGLQWVNQGFATQFGRGGPQDFEDPNYIEKLTACPVNGVDTHAELRRQVLNSFRIPSGGDDGNQL